MISINNLDDAAEHFARQRPDARFIRFLDHVETPGNRLFALFEIMENGRQKRLFLFYGANKFRHFGAHFRIKNGGQGASVPDYLAEQAARDDIMIGFVWSDGAIQIAAGKTIRDYTKQHNTIKERWLPVKNRINSEHHRIDYCFPLSLMAEIWPNAETQKVEKNKEARPQGQASLDWFAA